MTPPDRERPRIPLPPGIGLINFTWACVTLTASFIGLCLLAVASDRSELAVAPMSLAAWWLAPLALALGLLAFARVPEARRGAWVLLLVSVLGFALPFYLTLTGTVVSYDVDAYVRTHESRHPWAWLAAYAIVSATLTTLAVRLTRRTSSPA